MRLGEVSDKDLEVVLERGRQVGHYTYLAAQSAAGDNWQDGTGSHLLGGLAFARNATKTLAAQGEGNRKTVLREAFYEVVSAEPESLELLEALVGLREVASSWINEMLATRRTGPEPSPLRIVPGERFRS